jgi:hypothetical protein
MPPRKQPSEAQNRRRKALRARALGSSQKCGDCDESRRAALVPESPDDAGEQQGASCRNCRAKKRSQPDALPRPIAGRVCAWCKESHPATLEWHHIYGRATSPRIGVWLCKNDHAVATEWQRDLRLSFDAPTNVIALTINTLRGESAYLRAVPNAEATLAGLRQIVDYAETVADKLETFRAAIDSNNPTWPDMPEAAP